MKDEIDIFYILVAILGGLLSLLIALCFIIYFKNKNVKGMKK